MAIGLDEMRESARAFFIDVPLRRSNALTPLWWWLQALPMLMLGELSLSALRIMPLLLGAAALVWGYGALAPRVGRGSASACIALVAFSDVAAFTHARGEYAESLLLCLVLPALGLVGIRAHSWKKAVLWSLILLTHLGKGCFLVGMLALAEGIVRIHRGGASAARPAGLGDVRSILACVAIAAAPSAAWLFLASTRGPLTTDIGEVSGPFAMLRALTVDYARTKPHMVGGTPASLQVWSDPWVWPLSAVSAPLILAGAIAALITSRGPRRRLAHGLALWTLVGFVAVAGRGLIGARFHLLYLPATWLLAAVGWRRLVQGAWPRSAWRRLPHGLAVPLVLLVCGGGVMLALARGPIRWAPFARFEPYSGSEELAAIEAHRREGRPLPGDHGRTLYIDLANYFLRRADAGERDRRKALHYAALEVARVPNDARAWFYYAQALFAAGGPSKQALEAARRSRQLRPSPQIDDLIRRISGDARSGTTENQ